MVVGKQMDVMGVPQSVPRIQLEIAQLVEDFSVFCDFDNPSIASVSDQVRSRCQAANTSWAEEAVLTAKSLSVNISTQKFNDPVIACIGDQVSIRGHKIDGSRIRKMAATHESASAGKIACRRKALACSRRSLDSGDKVVS